MYFEQLTNKKKTKSSCCNEHLKIKDNIFFVSESESINKTRLNDIKQNMVHEHDSNNIKIAVQPAPAYQI